MFSEAAQPDISRFAAAMQPANSTVTPPIQTGGVPLGTSRLQKPSLKPKKKWLIKVGIVLTMLIGLGALIGLHVYSVGMQLQAQAKETEVLARAAYDAFKAQNLPEAEAKLKEAQDKFQTVEATYQKLAIYGKIPFAGAYYRDGEHGLKAGEHALAASLKASQAITPYADVLGFKGEGTFAGGTAENRIKLMLETLDKVGPSFDAILSDLDQANQELAQINPNRYPESIKGKAIKSRIISVQKTASEGIAVVKEFRPVIDQLPAIAGGKGERKKYLVLFQNNNELRPTGGFLTAYAVIFIENGKVSPEKSDDIYELDKKFAKKLPIPPTLGRYLTTEKNFHLRDMNTSPDFKTSMDLFFENYQTIKGEPDQIDGIIAVDTEVLKSLVSILGPIEVPGYGTFSTENDKRCDCAQIVYALSEIITRPTPYLRADRKGILGPMMQGILAKTYGAPKQLWPQLFELAWQSVEGRHVQMYFTDAKAQAAAEAVNGAGRMIAPTDGSDFFAAVDANLGGAKSNLFVDSEMKQIVSAPENGKITRTAEITYKNRRHGDNCNLEAGLLCLNATLHDWQRIYLPAGAELTEVKGFSNEPKVYDEAGFKVIDGFFNLEPLGTAKVIVNYTVPYTDTKTYKLNLWKQGGIDVVPVLMEVAGGEEQLTMDKDLSYTTAF
jgi:hypothetical protein